MRIIVVGAGDVGSSIADDLTPTHDVVVVEQDRERADAVTYESDVLAVHGDGTNVSTLQEADVEDADLLIASTDDDETNIVTCATAEILSEAFSIARVRNVEYLRTWRRNPERAFDVNFMVCTVLLAAESIVRVIGLPAAQDVDSFADGLVRMAQFEVPADSPVADQTVAQADRFESLTFTAVIRDDEVQIARGDTVIRSGDEVVVIGDPDSVQQFGADISPAEGGPRDVVIVGGSAVGYHTARLLEERGFSPKLVEQDPERARYLAEELPNTTVLESDATDRAFLEREHVGRADVVVTSLESDEQNLLAGLLAKRLGTRRAVSVTQVGAYSELFEEVGIDVAVNPRVITAEEITRFTREQRTENVAIIEDDRAEVVEIEVDADSVLAGRPIREGVADLPESVVIGAITRGGSFITPRGDTIVETGDHVVVFARTNVVDEVATKL